MKHGYMTLDGKFFEDEAEATNHENEINKGMLMLNHKGMPTTDTQEAYYVCINSDLGMECYNRMFHQCCDLSYRGLLYKCISDDWMSLATPMDSGALLTAVHNYCLMLTKSNN